MRALTTSHYEPSFHIPCSYKLNSLVKHKISLEHIAGQPFTRAMFILPALPEFSGFLSFSPVAIEPHYEEEGSKEMVNV